MSSFMRNDVQQMIVHMSNPLKVPPHVHADGMKASLIPNDYAGLSGWATMC